MSDLRELYQELILDHGRAPRNLRTMDDSTHHADGFNPLCGDKVKIYLKCEGDIIQDVSFDGSGCAISTASVSLLTECLAGKTLSEAEEIFDSFHAMVTGETGNPPDVDKLGKLAVFTGVCEFPARVKCATLAWHTLQAALAKTGDSVTTE